RAGAQVCRHGDGGGRAVGQRLAAPPNLLRERVPIDRAESQSGEEGLGGLGEQPELLEPLAPRLTRRAGGGQGTKTLSPQVRADGDRAEDAESAGQPDARRGGKPGAVVPSGG